MNPSLIDLRVQSHLTALATGGSVLPRRECPNCGSLMFKGYPQLIEEKCRHCKMMVLFEGENAKAYVVKPY